MQPSHEIRLKHLTCNSSPPSSHQHKSSTESHLPVLEEFVDKDIINHLLLIFWRLSMGSLLLINEFHVSVHAHSVVCDSLQPHGLQPRHASLSMGFPRQEYWSGLPFPPLGDLTHPGIEPMSLLLQGQADSLPQVPSGKARSGRMDTCTWTCMAEALCYPPEATTTLLISYHFSSVAQCV